jgi:SAM-dependent methyltransferase
MSASVEVLNSNFPIVLKGRAGDPKARVDAVVARLLATRQSPRVLEAGCGSSSRVELPALRHLVGIDIAQRQLDNNAALDEKHLGDLQSYVFPVSDFDLILCWDVIEHLPQPIRALERMAGWLSPGGALVLAFPNLWSLKGLVTKFTPYKVHEWFYRYVVGDKRSVKEWDQFGTTFHFSIAPPAMRRWAAAQGLEIIYDEVYEGPVQSGLRKDRWYMNIGFAALGGISRALSLGNLDLGLSDAVMVLRRPGGSSGFESID